MGPAWRRLSPLFCGFTQDIECVIAVRHARGREEDFVTDLLYIGYIVVGFAALWLLVKGVERFER
jgi:hypothetical protein